jgi:hypothetical protein
MEITRTSTLTGKTRTRDLPITEEQFQKYEMGVYVKHAFENLGEEEIRFVQYGITAAEFAAFSVKQHRNRCGAC